MLKNMLMFYDIETLTANTAAKPSERQPIEYIVVLEFNDSGKQARVMFPNLYEMLEYIISLKRAKSYTLIAHNGDKFDAHFLYRSIIQNYGIKPKNAFVRNAKNHEWEHTIKEEKGDFLHETRVKAKTSVRLDFRIKGVNFNTDDTAPKFQASIETMGKLLYHAGIIPKEGEKLKYDYNRYDLSYPMEYGALVEYAKQVFAGLSQHERQYVFNDTNILYTAWYNYDKIFPDFNIKKRTLSGNILDAYNTGAGTDLQLLNKFGKEHINYTDYTFQGVNLYDYIHNFYKGGLNMYNNRYIAKKVKDIVHIDFNSSYPNVMYHENFPTFLNSYGGAIDAFNPDPKYYYMIAVKNTVFNDWLKLFPSSVLKAAFVKYFSNLDDCIYLSSPHIELIEKIIGRPFNPPVESWLKWETRPFFGRDTIKYFYDEKVNGKKKGYSYGEIYVIKVQLNGIYGIPALRAHFNIFRRDESGEYENDINGFDNQQRNLVFASAVTAYAFRNLLMPLTYDMGDIDTAFIYADTDSLFLRRSYFDKVKDKLDLDHYRLGAWDIEHENVKEMVVLNHKKYAFLAPEKDKKTDIIKDAITVHAGGVTDGTFNTEMSFDEFIKTEFYDGATVPNLRHILTSDLVMALYEAPTKIEKGSKYPLTFGFEQRVGRLMMLMYATNEMAKDEELREDTIYIDTPFGTFSQSDIYAEPEPALLVDNIDLLLEKYKEAKNYVN